MRLTEVKAGKKFSFKHKLMRIAMNLFVDGGTPDVMLTLMYRNNFFGKQLIELFQEVMRNDSNLSVLQRELVAAATSKANQCPFCTTSHVTIASLAFGLTPNDESYYTRSSEELKAHVNSKDLLLMDFAEKMARNEVDIEKEDIERLKQAGFTIADIEDVMYIVFAFLHNKSISQWI